jgi:hypothetical protein
VGIRAKSSTRISSRLLYDRFVAARDETDLDALQTVLTTENVVDIQFPEALGEMVRSCLGSVSAEVSKRIAVRLAATDKFAMSRIFQSSGVRTPPVLAVTEVSCEEAATRFGYPIVLKCRIGSGGADVSLHSDLESLRHAVADSDPATDLRYYEKFIDGEKLNYAAAVSKDEIEQELAYRVTNWLPPLGIATDVETIDDERLLETGRHAIRVSGCLGLMNIDVMRDSAGLDWLIDFNPRVFGGCAAFIASGINLSEGYLRTIDARLTPPVSRSARPGMTIRNFPTSLTSVISSGHLVSAMVEFCRGAIPYLGWLGPRYCVSEALATVSSTLIARRAATAGAPKSS